MTRDETTQQLKQFGFDWGEAEQLADTHGSLAVEQQLEWFEQRKVTGDRLAFMRKALTTNLEPPAKKRAPAYTPLVHAPKMSEARLAAQSGIAAMPEAEREELRKEAIRTIARDVVGPKRAARGPVSFAEMKASWFFPDAWFDTALEAVMRDIFIARGKSSYVPLGLDAAVALANGEGGDPPMFA